MAKNRNKGVKLWQNRGDKLRQGGLTLAQINIMELTKFGRGDKFWQILEFNSQKIFQMLLNEIQQIAVFGN